jgi:hypothetical protein
MNEKRQNRYVFTSISDLIAFFSDTVPKKEILAVIRRARDTFKKRPNLPAASRKLQLIKKCEWELVRIAKKVIEHKRQNPYTAE